MKDELDHRVNIGLFAALIVFVVIYGVLIARYDGWGLALGWIPALIAAALTVYAIYRSDTLTRIIDALFSLPHVGP
ncbi:MULTISPECIES: hypothetical protein [unclassified Afipia]|jgi:hypothetical protein|uniref:hypothetical protein n=1 Tax=unclassified Afipia TaxID=2642050 RepID=UPI000400399E|nr:MULTISPECIES: hypothetical protein [unclassified Afipia]MBQ8106198.1 hypothetical protein [Afipia sp.]MBS4002764.1 hypothetical protein [Afipia sp.]WIG50122.1 MAG: hypothetical protein OJF48_001039 [Afipia sp.]